MRAREVILSYFTDSGDALVNYFTGSGDALVNYFSRYYKSGDTIPIFFRNKYGVPRIIQYLYIQFRDRAGNIANTVAETIYREQIVYSIRTKKFGKGSIEPSDPLTGEILVYEGSHQTVRITANEGYDIYQVTVDGSAIDIEDQSYTFENVQTDHDLEVRFRSMQHTIEFSSSEGGWISPCIFTNQCNGNDSFLGQISVNSGSDLRFTIVPTHGYEVSSIIVDGEVKPSSQTVQEFQQIDSDHSLYASFTKSKTIPVISNIPDMTFDENSSEQTFDIEVIDAESSSSELIIEFHSDNESLIPTENIVLKNIQGNVRTYSLKSLASQFGVAVITVKVTDTDQMTALKTFNVMVNNVYYPPFIGSIDNQTVNQNEVSRAHYLTISSQDTAILTIFVETNNTILLPVDNIYFTHNGQTGNSPFTLSVIEDQKNSIEITLEPVKGQSGSAGVTITVENEQSLSSSQYFQLEVIMLDHPPKLSLIENQSIDENTSSGKIPFTISDADGGQITLTGQSSNINLVPNNSITFHNGMQAVPSVISLALNPEIPQTLFIQVHPESDQWGACNIEIKATDNTNLTDISRFAMSIKEYIPKVTTYYGFVYNEYFMGVNDVQISLVQPEIQGYSTVVMTHLGTGSNGKTGDGYFALNLPVSEDIYYFNASKTGYDSITFNTGPEYIDSTTETSVLFNPLYLSNCANNQFISGIIENSGFQAVDLYLIGNETIIETQQVLSNDFSFCVSNAVLESYTIIASIPDYYTMVGISGNTFPAKNVKIKLTPVVKTDPISITDKTTEIIKRTITVNPVGGQTIILNKTTGSIDIGTIEIPVLKNECIDNNLLLEYQIITDSKFNDNNYTNGSDETIIATGLKSQCDHIEMEVEIPIESSIRLNDFQTGQYNIYVAGSRADLLKGKYIYTVDTSDINSVAGGKVRFRIDDSGVFGVGKISEEECVDCEVCVDCDNKPDTLCFIGTIENRNFIFEGIFIFLSVIILWAMKRNYGM
ncbi:hypothetical protein MHK_009809 [Candidatus Magnetomorum sp. HK-1]|nr:hypothetical protein MHK_009809 [Candidatus Magnetomorum sp. HK-1]